jgi:mannonate dehydratase
MLKITDARVIVSCPGRNFVTLKIETNEGLHGLGGATLNGRELAVASYLTDHVIPTLMGRDAQAIEDIWQYLYRGAYWRCGPVTMCAIGAVDTALWDIKAKQARLPLYQLLGGASRTSVLVYGHANGSAIEETAAEALCYRAIGYKAIRLQSGVPGLATTYGVSRNKLFYEPADAAVPTETVWSTTKYLPMVPKLFEAAREALGPDVDLLHDVHHRFRPSRPPASARIWSPIGRSGSKTRRPRRTPRRSGLSATTRRRRSRWAKYSTRFGTPGR